jgi:ParB family chromosome partitioning protein
METRSVLGRGLRSLIPDKKERGTREFHVIDVSLVLLAPNANQPRQEFDATELSQLASSIKAKGVLQPILVRKKGDGYEIIAGERRFRASKQLGLMTIPAIVKEADEGESCELALIENIQRSDLNSIEKAIAYKRYMNDFNLTQEQLAEKVGVNRSSIANTLRILTLPDEIQGKVRSGEVTFAHAKELLSIGDKEDQIKLMEQMISHNFTVAELRAEVKTHKMFGEDNVVVSETPVSNKLRKKSQKGKTIDPHVQAVKERLEGCLGTKVNVVYNEKTHKGAIQVEYYSLDDLERLVERIEEASF